MDPEARPFGGRHSKASGAEMQGAHREVGLAPISEVWSRRAFCQVPLLRCYSRPLAATHQHGELRANRIPLHTVSAPLPHSASSHLLGGYTQTCPQACTAGPSSTACGCTCVRECSFIFFSLKWLWRCLGALRALVPGGTKSKVGSAIKYLTLGVTQPLLGLFPGSLCAGHYYKTKSVLIFLINEGL